MANIADPDQLASSEANWSGSTLFANVGFIQVQQDKGLNIYWVCTVCIGHFVRDFAVQNFRTFSA